MKSPKMSARQKAHDFMVWRACESAGWNCTIPDVAKETGFSREKVRKILHRRGWQLQSMYYASDNEGFGGENLPVDRMMVKW